MLNVREYEFWFVTGSQHLYGEEALNEVAKHSQEIVDGFNKSNKLRYKIVYKPIVKTSCEITNLCKEANNDDNCAGIITWCHTFSPSKMWIKGLKILNKPLLHLHTQFNKEIPWSTMDMDFMNLNQSAHGDREHGFIGARMNIKRKVVVGHWQSEHVSIEIDDWMRAAVGYISGFELKVARFGDNMRNVAVTEGDKVEAEIKFGWTVDGYGIGDLVDKMNEITEEQIEALVKEYEEQYVLSENALLDGYERDSIKEQAKIELGLKKFLEEGGYTAFTTTFEDLHGMKQLPGLAVQRLMEQGYGFGGEGDWKTAALTRIMKVMADNKGTSFMEDYTYHLVDGNEMILGAHMLEVCPTIASEKPRLHVEKLGIGDREDPARMIFNCGVGEAVCASLVDIGGRMRLIVNNVTAVENKNEMPALPVARVLWKPHPDLKTSAHAWILAGGAHHTVFSFVVNEEHLRAYSEMVGMECLVIGNDTKINNFKNEILWNSIVYK